MSIADDPYPGATAPPEAIAGLAGSYRASAHVLAAHGDATSASNRAPWRLTAIHAVELYLNAYLRLRGRSPSEIRGLQHDMAKRATLAASCGLQFRAKTLAHLVSLGETRAYLVTRYDPAQSAGREPPNRLLATLDEVAAKVERALAQATARHAAARKKTTPQPVAKQRSAEKATSVPTGASGGGASPKQDRKPAAAVATSAPKTRPTTAAGATPTPAGKAKRSGRPPAAEPAASPGKRGGRPDVRVSARAPSPTSG